MNLWKIATQSLKHYFRSDLAIALGVAAATAVLTGALIVGDSMRQSLRGLTLDRLGKIDEMLVSEGFFRTALADQVSTTNAFKENYDSVTPMIFFPGGTVEYKPDEMARRAGQVAVLGIDKSFWGLDNSGKLNLDFTEELSGDTAIINQSLADDLRISLAEVEAGQATITVRIPKQTQMSADSALGKKTDLIESLIDLKVIKIIPTEGLGRFGLHPTQSDPLNVYLPITLLQESLARTVLSHKTEIEQANVLLFNGKGNRPPDEDITQQLRNEIRPTLPDYGLSLNLIEQKFNDESVYKYWSLSSDKMVIPDEAVESIKATFSDATPVFTYLANDTRKSTEESGIPFSMISAIEFGDSFQPVSSETNQPIRQLEKDEIVLNQWAAENIKAKIGDKLSVTYFEPETTHGSQTKKTAELTLVDIAKITKPTEPFEVSRGRVTRPEYKVLPTICNDADLTPAVPGVTDAKSIDDWDLPFETDTLRDVDNEYWKYYRTTPKAFVSLATGQRLWQSRFGNTTSFRIPHSSSPTSGKSYGGRMQEINGELLERFAKDEAKLGLNMVPIKRRGLAASSGSTPFDVLFLALSMFVIGAALILVSLLFRLGLQQRASEVGVLKATGFDQKKIRKLWLSEMLLVTLIGAVIGVALGVGYAWLMILGLTTWWVGAISRPFLEMHVSPISLIIGLLSGLLICVATIAWALRRTKKQPVRNLLSGQLESSQSKESNRSWTQWLAPILILIAIGLTVMATQLSGEAQAGSFMGAGFLVLTGLLMFVYQWLKRSSDLDATEKLSLTRLAMFSAKRNPLRSTLTIGLVAVASFLIAAVSSFRLSPSDAGTGGFDWVAQSSQPLFDDLSDEAGQRKALGAGQTLSAGTEFISIRYKSGEDASCNNLYQSTQPRVLGVPDQFIDSFDSEDATKFAWAGSLTESETEQQNPWQILNSSTVHEGTAKDPIPVVLDKNTANYSLKIYMLNTIKRVDYDSGETIHYRVVGFLANTILQGSLIMSEADFENAFPNSAGYQYFLVKDGEQSGSQSSAADITVLENRFRDQGFDARSAPKLLSNFMAVQNTYLSTFQTLGALGLLLGTFGLAAVQIRSVLERRKELGLMQAVGFSRTKLASMVLMENAWLLTLGLGCGVAAALFTTLPHWLVGTASIPWKDLGLMFAAIVAVGLLASWIGSRLISRMPLLESLRA